MLCTPNVDTNMHAASLAREWGFTSKISATAIYKMTKKMAYLRVVLILYLIYMLKLEQVLHYTEKRRVNHEDI